MIPKEKAKELVDWFLDEGLHEFGRYQSTVEEDLEGAKFCANKIVDEILKDLKVSLKVAEDLHPHARGLIMGSFADWLEVKTEIEKL